MSVADFPRPLPEADGHAEDHLTEAGAAERFVRLHGEDLRFVHPRGHWLEWRGHRWQRDLDGAVTRRALASVRDWQRAAVEIPDRERRQAVLDFLMRLEKRAALDNFMALAGAMKPVADDGRAWDADPWLLCTPNGVVDLRTGKLRDGDRADRITLSTAVAYEPDAPCSRWEEFLSEVLGGEEIVEFVWRALGYSLTGITTEQCLWMLYGVGANGKSTLLNLLRSVLGEYAWNVPFSSLEWARQSGIPNDLAALAGRRFVVASETNDGTRLNESRVKALTGGDTITARFLHAEFFEFEPVAKFWLAVNHKPVVRDDSHGFWRRIRLVGFARTFPVNAELPEALRAEAAGILAWLIRGCVAWQADGLKAPQAVMDATAAYAEESDDFGRFLAEACQLAPDAEVTASDLFDLYRRWAAADGQTDKERMSRTRFGRKASERLEKVRRGGGMHYLGVARK